MGNLYNPRRNCSKKWENRCYRSAKKIIAIKCLWIPVSNVDSERAFSVYGNIVTHNRTTLCAINVEVMLKICYVDGSD
ncbi:hypothetical protein PR048_020730 [Dryococelus australis]|uniref:HAT C-terminal dimerisation domain-containing protein n=1 Tax=Dryococelus australis TaxID=614101 RepID=A0ABQ9H773_9NEOP|nr:hypothetical protein PR048_020730 [Dryococelus australis]